MQNPAVVYLRKAMAAHDRLIALLKENLCEKEPRDLREPEYNLCDGTVISCGKYRKLGRGKAHVGLLWNLDVTVDEPAVWIEVGIYSRYMEHDGMTITEQVVAFSLVHRGIDSAMDDLWWLRTEVDAEHRYPQFERCIERLDALAYGLTPAKYAKGDNAYEIIEGMVELYKTYRTEPKRRRKSQKVPDATTPRRRKRTRAT